MTAKEVATKYFGANVFPSEITEKFLIHKKTKNPIQAKIELKNYKQFGYIVKSKTTSLGISYIAVKLRSDIERFNFNNK